MSAGAFQTSRYETDSGEILKCRVQPETLAFQIGQTANTAPTGSVDTPGSARLSGGKRKIGVGARAVYISFDTTAPTGYKTGTTIAVPVLRPALYNAAATATTGTYLGQSCRIVGRRAESVR